MQVTVIARKGATVLVEWHDEFGYVQRSMLPVSEVTVDEAGRTFCEAPEQGIPYGLDWESLIEFRATPEAVAHELRRAGIWTYEDMRRNPAAVRDAFRAAYGMDAQALMQAARTVTTIRRQES